MVALPDAPIRQPLYRDPRGLIYFGFPWVDWFKRLKDKVRNEHPRQIAFCNGTANSTNTTMTDIVGMVVNIGPPDGHSYLMRVELFVTADATGGVRVGFGGTIGTTLLTFDGQITFIRNDTDVLAVATQLTGVGAFPTPTGHAGATQYHVTITGLVSRPLVQAGGQQTLTVQFSQQVANGTTTIRQGSWIEMIRILPAP